MRSSFVRTAMSVVVGLGGALVGRGGGDPTPMRPVRSATARHRSGGLREREEAVAAPPGAGAAWRSPR
jgi:hypothetical protein